MDTNAKKHPDQRPDDPASSNVDARLDSLISKWIRVGVGFTAEAAPETPDIERLLLETVRLAPGMARLFIMAATWLHRYGDLIAKHRLRRLIFDELEPEHRAAMGLLLEIAQQDSHPPQFVSIIRDLSPEAAPRPLFDIVRTPALLAERAKRRASPISARWGLWCDEFEFKNDALRPPVWVMGQNPGLITRADFRGDLRASVLASLEHDPDAGLSELHLARCCGGSRAQVRSSLDNLEMTGRVRRIRMDGEKRTRITLVHPAAKAG